MFDWITSRLKPSNGEPTHPLATDGDIAAWLAEQPTFNAPRTLQALEEWLGNPEQLSQQLDPGQMARAVGRLDEFAQPALAMCWEDVWLDAGKERQFALPTRPLEAYYTNSFACCLLVVQRLAADPAHAQDKKQLTRFALRAMHAWVQLKKLARLGYRPLADHWWSQAHEIVRSARALGILYIEQRTYPQHDNGNSVWLEYLAGLMLETLPIANLSISAIEVADRLVRWVVSRAQYTDTATHLSLFAIDPDGNAGPQRLQSDKPVAAGLRCVGPGTGYQQMMQLRAAMMTTRQVPPWLESAGLVVEQLLELLATIITHWSNAPPSRKHPRTPVSGKIQVVNGLALARRMIAASEFARSGRSLDYEGYIKSIHLRHKGHEAIVKDVPPPPKTPMEILQLLETAGDRQMMDHWEVIDASTVGMGVRCFARRHWHAIGTLVAWRRPDDLDWRIGIIRRLGASHGTPNAGLTTFGGTPYCSQVRATQADEVGLWTQQTQETSGRGWRDAVMLSFEERLLLAPPGTFSAAQRIDVSVRGRFRPAEAVALEAKGADYELIRFADIGNTRHD